MTKQQIIENILQGLQRQKFADWYNTGDFDKWISGDENAPAVEEIKEDIAKLFNLT